MTVTTRSRNVRNIQDKNKNDSKQKIALKNECISCQGMWGHRSTVNKVYWRDGIDYGYRPQTNLKETFFTLFSMHNETMNIWTHLVGFLITFLAISLYFIDQDILFSYAYPFIWNVSNDFKFNNDLFIQQTHGPYYFFAFIISAAICLLFSSIYHLFQCMSLKAHDDLLWMDVTGVALLVGSSYFPAIYLGFYCHEALQEIYLGVSLVVLVTGILSTFSEIKIFKIRLGTFVFAGLVVTGLIPTIHWLVIAPPIFRNELYFGIIGLFFFYSLGFLFFLSKFPEIVFPNQFWSTHLFSSHTLWHMCILCAIYSWFSYLCAHHEHLETHGCDPYHQYWKSWL